MRLSLGHSLTGGDVFHDDVVMVRLSEIAKFDDRKQQLLRQQEKQAKRDRNAFAVIAGGSAAAHGGLEGASRAGQRVRGREAAKLTAASLEEGPTSRGLKLAFRASRASNKAFRHAENARSLKALRPLTAASAGLSLVGAGLSEAERQAARYQQVGKADDSWKNITQLDIDRRRGARARQQGAAVGTLSALAAGGVGMASAGKGGPTGEVSYPKKIRTTTYDTSGNVKNVRMRPTTLWEKARHTKVKANTPAKVMGVLGAGAAGGFAYNRYGAAKERRAENRQSALRQARVAAPADAPKQSAADRRFEEYVRQMDRAGKKGNRTVF